MARATGTTPYSFAAIDFETANYQRNSACAVGIAIVRAGQIAALESHLLRPPTSNFYFTHIHGLTWEDVHDAPTFAEVWTGLSAILADIDFFAAHNAAFDRSVLDASCRSYGLSAPPQPFVCTVDLARAVWNIRPTKLPDVCRRLRIQLDHHDAASDAEACARIVLAAAKRGWQPHGRGQ